MWVLLLEKAWAKVHGTYLHIEAGKCVTHTQPTQPTKRLPCILFSLYSESTALFQLLLGTWAHALLHPPCPLPQLAATRALPGLTAAWYCVLLHSPGNALADLTGAPHTDIAWKDSASPLGMGTVDVEDAWTQLVAAHASGWPICAGVPDVIDRDTEADFGLPEEHAYSVLSVRELNGEKMIKLRNPWGKGEWQGKWGDRSSEWTDETRTQLDWHDWQQDGQFWMQFEDFCYFFNMLTWLSLEKTSSIQSSDLFTVEQVNTRSPQLLNTAHIIEFSTSVPTSAWLSILQQDRRLDTIDTTTYAGVRFELVR